LDSADRLPHATGELAHRRGKVAFVYSNSRLALAAEVAAGTAPDSTLLGQNHLAELGYETFVHEPRIRAVSEQGGLAHRVRWSARELVVPWELGDADVVVTPLCNLLPAAARLRRRPRTVLLDFGLATILDRRRGASRRVLTTSLRSTAAIVCLSESQRERLLGRTDVPPERVHTVLLGIDHEFLAPGPAPGKGERGYALTVGKDLARDYRTLAQAAARIDAGLVVVTEARNVRGIDLPPNVEVRRGLTYAELRDLYAGAGCVVLPLRRLDYPYGTESGGLTALLEAMAMGKPVVASDRPIVHEYTDAGESALVVPPEEPEALAAAIERVLSDGGLAARLGAAARRRIEERHTMRHFARGLAGVFDGLP
jgi:glycosyltransferase involved in cell wall biosynthesis